LNFSIITTSPAWLLIVCIAIGLIFALLLYYKNKRDDFPKKYLLALFGLRFLSSTLIAFLLLNPLIKTVFKRVEKPIIIFAHDNTASLVAVKDSLYYKTEYLKHIEKLKNKFSSEYDFRYFNFSEKILNKDTVDYSGKQTDISQLFYDLSIRFANRNVGALVLSTDGLYNKGINPLYSSQKLSFPVFTIALGDTTVYRDVKIKKVNYNKITYIGNTFPVEININAAKCKGLKTEVRIYKDKELIFSKPIMPLNNNFSESITVMLEAKEAGLQRYRIVVEAVEGEHIIQNNAQEIFIQVLDSRRKVLILGAVPHPDLAALKNSIDNNYNYEAETYILDEYKKPVEDYSLIILHQIPYIKNSALQLIERINKAEIPILYILGTETNLPIFNSLKAGLTISVNKAGFNNATPSYSNNFALFKIDDATQNLFSELPPLVSHFGTYKIMNSASVMLYQKIGKVVSDIPLVLFNDIMGQRNGVICGTGLWRWRITNYAKLNNHDAYNEFVNKIMQYLTVKADKSNFRISVKRKFLENELIIFNAELYNDSYELINEPEVELTITNDKNNSFRYVFGKSGNAYSLNAGFFPIGEYSYIGKAKIGEKIYSTNGAFTVSELNIEYVNTVADHSLLYNIAKQTNAKMLYPSEIQDIYELIKNKEEIKPVSYVEKRYNDLVNIFPVLAIILLLISIEWFIRKYMGSY